MWYPVVVFLIAVKLAQSLEYKVTDQVEFTMTAGGREIGVIRIGLFGDLCPRTVHNFKVLATRGIHGRSYKGSKIHRIIEKFMIQGGDIMNGDGTGSISIYGPQFADENFIAKHSAPGMVSMANSGPDTNGCQFFITTVPTPHLDGKHVVFGKVVSGQNIVHMIEHMRRDSDDCPLDPIVIKRSRVIRTPSPFYVSDNPYNLWEWIKGTTIPLSFSFAILGFFYWIYQKMCVIEKGLEKLE